MDISVLLIMMSVIVGISYMLGKGRSVALSKNVGGIAHLNSLPFYYGTLTALWAGLPAIALLIIWSVFQADIIEWVLIKELPAELLSENADELQLSLNSVYNIAAGQDPTGASSAVVNAADLLVTFQEYSKWLLSALVLLLMFAGTGVTMLRINPELTARLSVEKVFRNVLLGCSCLAILTTLGIVFSVLFEAIRFFHAVPITEFLFGLTWSPQNAMRADQVTGESSFGAVPLFAGTLLIALIAMIVAVPTGLMSAIYLSEYAPAKVRSIIKPLLEILAGIPTVVYGFVAALTVAPFIRDIAIAMGLDHYLTVTSESALAAGLVMGVMIIPFVSSLSDDIINSVPQSLRDGALGLGSTQSEVVKRVVIPAALPGIVSSVLLAISRAIGETMIVVMAAGLAAKLTANPLDSVTTVTVQIVTLLVGDQEFDSPKTLAAFALGLMLFIVTLSLNYISLHVVKKYREQYE